MDRGHGTIHAALMRNAELMTDFHPLPEPRKTLTHANCVVSTPLGYRPLHLDLHVPPGDGPFPVVLWIHGGGWITGSRAWTVDQRFHERMVARGYAVADVDYRLALEATYPAQQADIDAAVRGCVTTPRRCGSTRAASRCSANRPAVSSRRWPP